MSKRRGKVLVDALSIERRHWYSDLQEPGIKSFKEYEHVHLESKPAVNRHFLLDDDDENELSSKLLSFESSSSNKYSAVVPSQWIRSLNTVRSKGSVLICFHGIGNNHSYFKKWGHALSVSGIALYSVCVPGHMNRFNEPMSLTLVEMANFIYAAAKTMKILEGSDVILFGHCAGAIIAYEVARLMQRDNLSSLKHLIISSAISPLIQTKNNKNKRGVIKYFLQSDKDLLERVKLMGGMIDEDFTASRMDMIKLNLKLIRRDFLIHEKYLIHLMDDPHYDAGLHSASTSTAVSSAVSVASVGKGSLASVNPSSRQSGSASVASTGLNRGTPMTSIKGSVNNSANNSITANGGRSSSPTKSQTLSMVNSKTVGSSHNSSHLNSSAASVSSGKSLVGDLNSQQSSSKNKKRTGDESSSEEEEEEVYIPPVLYKLQVPIATVLAIDNQIVELKDVNAWSELTSNYSHIAVHDGGHNYLRLKENRVEVLGVIEKAFNGLPL